jgi:hypothetical protein
MVTPNDLYQSPLYDGTLQANDYTLMQGVCVLPLAEDPPTDPTLAANYSPVVVARLHAPYRIRNYNSCSTKRNNPPVAPAPIDQGAFVFIGGDLQFVTKPNNTGLTYDWTVNASYTFVENCISRLQDGFVLGTAMPFPTDSDIYGIQNYGSFTPTIGAIAKAGPNAIAGYNLGNLIAPIPTIGNQTAVPTGMYYAWSYTLSAFFPGNFLNDQLANGGGTSNY